MFGPSAKKALNKVFISLFRSYKPHILSSFQSVYQITFFNILTINNGLSLYMTTIMIGSRENNLLIQSLKIIFLLHQKLFFQYHIIIFTILLITKTITNIVHIMTHQAFTTTSEICSKPHIVTIVDVFGIEDVK